MQIRFILSLCVTYTHYILTFAYFTYIGVCLYALFCEGKRAHFSGEKEYA